MANIGAPVLPNKRTALGDLSNAFALHPAGFDKATNLAVPVPGHPANVRVTRQAAARHRLLLEQQQLQLQLQQSLSSEPEPMAIDTNLDVMDDSDPQQCCHYVKDIYAYLREREQCYRVSPKFMQAQKDINSTMRGILIDWLVEVAEEYKLEAETLHLSVNYIDRFLSHVPVARSKLQLVGVTCMLIASKYEEIHPPAVDEFVYISDNTYKREEILHMEGTILNRLQFDLSIATSKVFLNRYLKAAKAGECDATTAMLCQYLCELTLQEYGFLKYSASEIAASALRLALHTMRLPAWSPLLQHVSGKSAEELNACVVEMLTVFRKAESSSLQAVRDKYSNAKFLCVSMLLPPSSAPQ
uniref:Cyclin N-terminal domain-containing protein n=1 Tax=Coccolithus braarudii TaxID=221442 RepID=A0A7S0L6B3_9EUKA|mmetsp:Transcript_22290/g.48120  ORF Transcript_22290/g.48120 Transcript_22290/m.48120 type:complete len:357 (+) Transcript_22290:72-1142(+)